MKKIIALFCVLASTTSFAQSREEYHVFCESANVYAKSNGMSHEKHACMAQSKIFVNRSGSSVYLDGTVKFRTSTEDKYGVCNIVYNGTPEMKNVTKVDCQ